VQHANVLEKDEHANVLEKDEHANVLEKDEVWLTKSAVRTRRR
jgi:hypothetical protein